MAKKPKKQQPGGTPATVALTAAGTAFTVHAYDHDPSSPSYGEEAAEALGVSPDRVFKTLVADVDGALTVAVVPVAGFPGPQGPGLRGGRQTRRDGGPGRRGTHHGLRTRRHLPLGQRKRLRTVLDASARAHATICVSAGRRGLEVELAATDLAELTGATFAEIARNA